MLLSVPSQHTRFEPCQNYKEQHKRTWRLHIYIPDKINVVANHEISPLEQISPDAVAQLVEIRSKTMVSSSSCEVDTIFHINKHPYVSSNARAGTRHIRKVRAVSLYLNIGGSEQSCTHAAPSIECLRSH